MVMGYILTGKNNAKVIEKIRDFALPLGIAFQIRDDILGVFGDKFKTGKSDISDIIEGKFTLLVNIMLKLLKGQSKEKFIRLFTKKEKSMQDVERIKKIIYQSGALKKSLAGMEKLFNEALQNLKRLSIGKEEKIVLTDLIENLRKF